jgi:hypothetical protein
VNTVQGLFFSGFRNLLYRDLLQFLECGIGPIERPMPTEGNANTEKKDAHIITVNGIRTLKSSVRAVEISTLRITRPHSWFQSFLANVNVMGHLGFRIITWFILR